MEKRPLVRPWHREGPDSKGPKREYGPRVRNSIGGTGHRRALASFTPPRFESSTRQPRSGRVPDHHVTLPSLTTPRPAGLDSACRATAAAAPPCLVTGRHLRAGAGRMPPRAVLDTARAGRASGLPVSRETAEKLAVTRGVPSESGNASSRSVRDRESHCLDADGPCLICAESADLPLMVEGEARGLPTKRPGVGASGAFKVGLPPGRRAGRRPARRGVRRRDLARGAVPRLRDHTYEGLRPPGRTR
jgi:hypothetical protein